MLKKKFLHKKGTASLFLLHRRNRQYPLGNCTLAVDQKNTKHTCVRARARAGDGGAMQCQTPTNTAAQSWMYYSTECLCVPKLEASSVTLSQTAQRLSKSTVPQNHHLHYIFSETDTLGVH